MNATVTNYPMMITFNNIVHINFDNDMKCRTHIENWRNVQELYYLLVRSSTGIFQYLQKG